MVTKKQLQQLIQLHSLRADTRAAANVAHEQYEVFAEDLALDLREQGITDAISIAVDNHVVTLKAADHTATPTWRITRRVDFEDERHDVGTALPDTEEDKLPEL